MVGLLADLGRLELPSDPLLGPTTLNVGTIRGGSAANVFAGECEVEIMIRLVGDAQEVRKRVEALVAGRAEVVWGSHIQPQSFHVIDGFETTTVAYTSDVPILAAWGRPLMFGPGSIHHAHTEEEHVSLEDLRSAVDTYVRIARALVDS
jgi:acetylornithine deacetylase